MKKALLIVLVLCSFMGYGQSVPFDTLLTHWRAYNNTNVTTKTAAHSITPQAVGAGIGDSLAYYILLLNSMIVPANGLQGTLNQGNKATSTSGGVDNFSLAVNDADSYGLQANPTDLIVMDASGDQSDLDVGALSFVDGSTDAAGTYGKTSFQLTDATSVNGMSGNPLAIGVNNTSGGYSRTLSILFSTLDYFQENTGTSDILHSKIEPPKVVPAGTHIDTFYLPYKSGAGGTFAMTSDIPNTAAQYTTSTTATTITPTSTVADARSLVMVSISAQATSLTINAPTGSWAIGQILLFNIQDNGTPQSLTWNAAYQAGSTTNNGVLPISTLGAGHALYQFMYAGSSKFYFTGYATGY